jgi:hypothetical protein
MNRLKLLLVVSNPTMRSVKIIGLRGHLMDLNMPRGDVSCLDIMHRIECEAGIPWREQKLMWGDIVLMPRNKIPNDDVTTLNLIRVQVPCGHCGCHRFDNTNANSARRNKQRNIKNMMRRNKKFRTRRKKRPQRKATWKSPCPEHIPEKVFPTGIRDNGECSWRCIVCKEEL